MIQAVIFDYFDVIRPTSVGVRQTYYSLGGDVEKDDVFLSDVTTAANLGYITNADEQIATRLGVSVNIWRDALEGSRANDQTLLTYIAQLRSRGIKTGLLSNAGAGSLNTFFTKADVQRYFDATLLSGDVGLYKPEAAFFRLIAEKLAFSPQECIMVDDRPEFCDGARRVGMHAVVYHHFTQCKKQIEAVIAAEAN